MPPSDDLRDSSALRQEGPQQECALKHIATVAMTAQSDPHASATEYRRSLIEICNFTLAALSASRTAQDEAVTTFTPLMWTSMTEEQRYEEYIRVRQTASRTAQAPQQEGGFVTSVRVMRRPSDDAFRFFTGGTIELLRLSRADAVRVALDILELADVPSSLQTDLAAAQARIQVLETSVDYLRNLIDHPVKQQPRCKSCGCAKWEHDPAVVGQVWPKLDQSCVCGSCTAWVSVPPPVAPAEGDQ